jgi:hypothetical protein
VTFETPLQPVVARRARQTPRVIAAMALVAIVLVALHPWSASLPEPPSDRSAFAARGQANETSQASLVPSPTPTEVPLLYGSPPPADRFKAEWSVVAVREFGTGEYSIAQQAVEPRSAPRDGTVEASTCDAAAGPDVGTLPGGSVRLIGAVAPNAGHGWIRLTLLDGSVARAFAVLVNYPPGTQDLAVGLFGTSTLWPPGGYRFYAVDDSGIGRYLYVCLGA